MTRIGESNYTDHGWNDTNSPEKATSAKGEADLDTIINYLGEKISGALAE